jgi:DinB superfamily
MSGVDDVLGRVVALGELELGRPWSFRGRTLDVRNAVYWALVEAQEALTRLAEGRQPESRRILALAERAFGDLRGLLLGVPDDLLDRPPREGDWPLRQTLRHVLEIERRYMLHTSYAVERRDAEPVRLPDERLAAAAQIDATGGTASLLARIGEARAETNRRLGDVPPAMMTRPTIWAGYDVDVRFRLHRFAPHVTEHTIQCEKTLDALGRPPSEGRQIARRLAAALGEIDALGGAAETSAIAQRLAERVGPALA